MFLRNILLTKLWARYWCGPFVLLLHLSLQRSIPAGIVQNKWPKSSLAASAIGAKWNAIDESLQDTCRMSQKCATNLALAIGIRKLNGRSEQNSNSTQVRMAEEMEMGATIEKYWPLTRKKRHSTTVATDESNRMYYCRDKVCLMSGICTCLVATQPMAGDLELGRELCMSRKNMAEKLNTRMRAEKSPWTFSSDVFCILINHFDIVRLCVCGCLKYFMHCINHCLESIFRYYIFAGLPLSMSTLIRCRLYRRPKISVPSIIYSI